MKKIVTVIGARPQFVKMTLVSKTLRAQKIEEVIIHTGQHYDMNLSDAFFRELNIPSPKYNLKVGSGSRAWQINKMISRIKRILSDERPSIVLVYGDTNSTLAGALAASKLGVKVAHVEAGLRSFNNKMPEEKNRIATDNVSNIFFCPTKTAVCSLKKEGKEKGIYRVGDVMHDSIKKYCKNLGKINTKKKNKYILCTIHRAENTNSDKNLRNIFKTLEMIGTKIILPLHPRTLKYLRKYGIKVSKNVKVIKPVSYKKMLKLEKYAALIITDSGGVQKEAFILKVPCITLRNETEWVETVKSGANVIVGTNPDRIIRSVRKMLKSRIKTNAEKFYGNGYAYKKIVSILKKELKG